MTWSIRARLTAWYTAVVVCVLVAGAASVAAVQRQLGLQRLDAELQRLMLTVEGVMRTEFNEGLDLFESAEEVSIEVLAPDRTMILTQPDGRLLEAWGVRLPEQWLPPTAGPLTVETVVIGGVPRRVVHRRVEYNGHRYIAAVMVSLDGLELEHTELMTALAIGVLVALLVAAVGGWVVGRQTLQPLGSMAQQATAITERDLTARLQTPNPGDELGRLAVAFNALLDRLATVLNGQRQFMADASHELRTPVSVVRTTAQVMLQRESRPEAEYRESLAIVAEQSARLSRLVDSMFLLSRAEARGIPLIRESLYLDELVRDCARALRVVAEEKGVDVQVAGDNDVALSGDSHLLRQMIGNLLHNAVQHARPSGVVAATLEQTTDSVFLRVVDDGPGIPREEHERIFQRFVRLDLNSRGAGLGLPIARWIAEAHHGQLTLEFSHSSGSCFMAHLPSGTRDLDAEARAS